MSLGFGPSPSSYVLPDERRVFRGRPHWAAMGRPVTTAAAVIAGLWLLMLASTTAHGALWVLTSVLWYGQLGVIGWLAYQLAYLWTDILMVTDKRIMRVTGVIDSRMDYMPIGKVTDGTFKQSFIGIRLHYGYMRLESAGQRQSLEHIPYIARPHAFYEAITKIVVGKDDLPPPRDGQKAIGQWTGARSTDDISHEWDGNQGD